MLPLVPHFILEKYREHQFSGTFDAGCLFVDISGFTPMTEMLTKFGKDGAETLADILHRLFEPMVRFVYENDGFICNFTGDGFIALFPGRKRSTFYHLLATARNIQTQLSKKSTYDSQFGSFVMGIKIGAAYGKTEWGILRPTTENSKHFYYFRGLSIDRAALAEKHATTSAIIIDANIYKVIAHKIKAKRIDNFYHIQSIDEDLPAPIKVELSEETLKEAEEFVTSELIHRNMQGEFRNVITVFLSLKDITTYEHLEVFMQPLFELQKRYGGYLNKIAFGDKGCSILLFWGAPISQENDIDRAINFVLDLRSAALLPFRAGITYRIMFAGFIGSELRQEYSCYGRGVNLAARMMMTADWGELWTDENITRIAEKRFNLKMLGYFPFKGFAQELPAYAVQGRSDSHQFSFYEGHITGRKKELEQLGQFIQPIYSDQFAGVISVYGDAGIGKSRLIEEFKRMCSDRLNPTPAWFYCPADEILRQSLNPFRYFLKSYFNQSQLQSVEDSKKQFKIKLRNLINDTPDPDLKQELKRTSSVLGALVDLYWQDSLYDQLNPQSRFENMLDALKTLIKAESQIQPVIIELEDAHWLDVDSIQFVQHLTRNIDSYPIAIIATYRREEEPEPLNPDIHNETIELRGFSIDDIHDFAQELLSASISSDLAQKLLDRTSGNPFFVEQLLRYMQEMDLLIEGEDGLTTKEMGVVVPSDVRAALIARLDRLTLEVKQVVQTASVLGREFEVKILSHMLNNDPHLDHKIESADEEDIWSALSQIRYIFKHALLRDAAYDMQLRSYRLLLHRLAAEAYEDVHQMDLIAFYGEIAYHYDQASVPEKALYYFRAAGQYAQKNFQNDLALQYYDKLLVTLNTTIRNLNRDEEASAEIKDLTTQMIDALMIKGDILEHIGKWTEALIIIREAINQAESEQDLQRLSTSVGRLGWLLYLQGDNRSAMKKYEEQLKICKSISDKSGTSAAFRRIGLVYMDSGDFKQAMEYFNRTLKLSQEIDDKREFAKAISDIGKIYLKQNEYDRAMECYERAFVLDLELGDKLPISNVFSNMGDIYVQTGDYDKAMKCYERHLKVCEKLGDKRGIARTVGRMGVVHNRQNRVKHAMAYFTRHLKVSEELGDKRGIAQTARDLGIIYENADDIDQAVYHFELFLKKSEELENHADVADACALLGATLFKAGRQEEALTYYQRSYKLYDSLNQTEGINHIYQLYGELYLAQGDLEKAFQYFQDSLSLAEKNQNLKRVAKATLSLGQTYARKGDLTSAVKFYSKNIEFCKTNGLKKYYLQTLEELGNLYYQDADYETAVQYYTQQMDLSEKFGMKNGNMRPLTRLAAYFLRRGNMERKSSRFNIAKTYFDNALKYIRKLDDKLSVSIALKNIGRALEGKGHYKDALSHYTKSLKINRALGIKHEINSTYGLIAGIFIKLGDYDQAIRYYEQQILLFSKTGAIRKIADIYLKIGTSYEKKGESESARENFQRALAILEDLKRFRDVSQTLGKIAQLCLQNENYDQAIKYVSQQIEIGERLEDNKNLAEGYGLLAEICIKQEKLEGAIEYYKKRLQIQETLGDKQLMIHTLGDLGRAYYRNNMYEKALDCTKQQRQLTMELNAR